jgi:Fur family ferric uptake transcriptional regulator
VLQVNERELSPQRQRSRYGAAVSGGWLEEALGRLRAAQYRDGGARRAVLEELAAQRCCLTAMEIHDRLRVRGRTVGIASIYRAVDVLLALDLVQRVDVGDGLARYEPVLAGGDHHHHVVCDSCGRVEPFSDDRVERAIHAAVAGTGYEVGAHEVVLRGACATCR